jgi:hypothetical protein
MSELSQFEDRGERTSEGTLLHHSPNVLNGESLDDNDFSTIQDVFGLELYAHDGENDKERYIVFLDDKELGDQKQSTSQYVNGESNNLSFLSIASR